MDCLNCSTEMNTIDYEGVKIDYCPGCYSAWLDKGEVTQVVENKDEKFSPDEILAAFKNKWKAQPPASSDKNCPQCQKEMKSFNYCDTGVILDRCPEGHGLWFNPGELQKVQVVMEFYDSGKLPEVGATRNPSDGKVCPHCTKSLHEETYEGVVVDLCGSCAGVYLDSGEINEIINKREQQFTTDEKALVETQTETSAEKHGATLPQVACPACASLMRQFNYSYSSGIILDYCEKDNSVWLDASELEKVQIFAEGGEDAAGKDLQKFAEVMKKVKTKTKERRQTIVASIQPSHFSGINRMYQSFFV